MDKTPTPQSNQSSEETGPALSDEQIARGRQDDMEEPFVKRDELWKAIPSNMRAVMDRATWDFAWHCAWSEALKSQSEPGSGIGASLAPSDEGFERKEIFATAAKSEDTAAADANRKGALKVVEAFGTLEGIDRMTLGVLELYDTSSAVNKARVLLDRALLDFKDGGIISARLGSGKCASLTSTDEGSKGKDSSVKP